MAEPTLSVLQRRCLDCRLADHLTMEYPVAAWVAERNATSQTIGWRFTTENARIQRQSLYPAVHE